MAINLRCLWLTGLLGVAQQVPFDLTGKLTDLQVVVIDSFGYVLPEARIQVERIRDERVVERFAGQPRMRLEPGTYRLAVDPPGFRRAVKTVTLGETPRLVILGTVVPYLASHLVATEVAGRVPDLDPDSKCEWVRLIPLFAGEPALDARVLLNQYFAFENLDPGRYLAMVFGPERVCRLSEVTIRSGKRQEIVIPRSPVP